MTLIDMLRPEQRQQLRQMRYRIYNREYMRRIREQRKLLCVGVDLPIEAGTCGRLVHAGCHGRDAHCCAPPVQIRTWSLNHPAPTSGHRRQNRCSGHGCRMRRRGQNAATTRPSLSSLVRSSCDRRRMTRSHMARRRTANRLRYGKLVGTA